MVPHEGMTRFKTPLILFGLAVLTRLPFTSRLLYNMDSVQFALGMEHFDVTLHQPHPPGYFLYVMAGRLAMLFTPDPNTALVSISIITGALTVVVVYCLGREVFDERAGLAAGVFALTSPIVWFHGEVALSYMPEALMSSLVGYLCFRVLRGETGLYWAAAVMLGISGGIRQNTMVFLMPLWLYSIKGIGLRRTLLGFVILCCTVAAWYFPMLAATGGYAAYSFALKALWEHSVWGGLGLGRALYYGRYVVFFVLYGLGMAAAPLLALAYFRVRGKARPAWDRGTAVFFLVWLAPAALFHALIFFQPGEPGYVLIYLVGLLVLSGGALAAVSETLAQGREGPFNVNVGRASLIFLAAVNVAFFLFRTEALSARTIIKHDRTIESYVRAVRAGFSPGDTEIIGMERFVFSYRHAMYYLPEFRVHNDQFMYTPGGQRVLCGQGGKTCLERRIEPAPAARRFIDFLDYTRDELASLPKTAKADPVGGGYYLVHYDGFEDLRNSGRIAPEMLPGQPGPAAQAR